MALPARFQRARHPLGAPRVIPLPQAPLPRLGRPASQPPPRAVLEAMRAGAARAERLQRWLAQERRNARWRARNLAELRRAQVQRTTDTSAWPTAFYVRAGHGVVYRSVVYRSATATAALLLALTVVLAPALARAQDAGPPPPGRAVELVEGTPAPYAGSLVDRERMGAILAKRWAAEAERDALRLSEQDARAQRDRAQAERDQRTTWGVVLGIGGGALAVGLITGLVLGLVSWGK